MSESETRAVKLAVVPKDQPLFSIGTTLIEIVDEAAGEFVTVTQVLDGGQGQISIEPEEWPVIRAAIDRMVGECREDNS